MAEVVLTRRSDPTPVRPSTAPVPASALAADGIPAVALAAYRNAARWAARAYPGCGLPWQLLAAIGRVESDHGRFGGAVLLRDGTSTPRIIGIRLDGSQSATVTDTDDGRLDGDHAFDRAVGPMQFIPGTWRGYGADGDGDGVRDPFDVNDAALAAAHYLCAAGGDVRTSAGLARAVLAYNYSRSYLETVVALERSYARGATLIVPTLPGTPPRGRAPVPPVDPGPPRGLPSPSPSPTRTDPTHPPSSPPRSTTSTRPTPSGTPSPTCPAPSSTAASTSPSSSGSTGTSTSPTTSPTPSSTSPNPSPSGSGTDPTTSPAPGGTPTCPMVSPHS